MWRQADLKERQAFSVIYRLWFFQHSVSQTARERTCHKGYIDWAGLNDGGRERPHLCTPVSCNNLSPSIVCHRASLSASPCFCSTFQPLCPLTCHSLRIVQLIICAGAVKWWRQISSRALRMILFYHEYVLWCVYRLMEAHKCLLAARPGET